MEIHDPFAEITDSMIRERVACWVEFYAPGDLVRDARDLFMYKSRFPEFVKGKKPIKITDIRKLLWAFILLYPQESVLLCQKIYDTWKVKWDKVPARTVPQLEIADELIKLTQRSVSWAPLASD